MQKGFIIEYLNMNHQRNRKKIYMFFKRLIDISISLIGIIVLAPLLLIVLFIVWLDIGCPVLFTQTRPGIFRKPFKMIKFRTMTNECDSKGKILPDVLRTTSVGRIIRRTSLDELPELFNVLKGDMSLVGPRPLLLKYLPFFTDRENLRHNIRPGITGHAQVNGRNLLSWDERLEMDVIYVENISFWMDVKIFYHTVVNVLIQKDVLSVSSEVIPDFDDHRMAQLKIGKSGN
jgi:lipopolysaccharide/colanic/teichoic acid biosynthesis glycosyltransferase